MFDKMMYMPAQASAHAAEIDRIINLTHWLMAALFVGWMAFFIFALVRFRKSRNPQADYAGVKSKANTWVELGVAVVEAVLLIGFSIPLWGARVNEIPAGADAVTVRVVAQQFAWNVWYPGPDGRFGDASPERVNEETNPLGLDREDPAGQDDITTINQLHLPVDRPAVVHLSSKDVIHSFSLPHMRVKQDAIPGMVIPTWFVPTKTTEDMRQELGNDEFVYEIACAQLCGNSHYNMRGFLTVHTQEGYDAWLAEQAAAAEDTDAFWD